MADVKSKEEEHREETGGSSQSSLALPNNSSEPPPGLPPSPSRTNHSADWSVFAEKQCAGLELQFFLFMFLLM